MKHYGENSVRRKSRKAKIPYSEQSHTTQFPYGKNPNGENSVRQKFRSAKSPYGYKNLWLKFLQRKTRLRAITYVICSAEIAYIQPAFYTSLFFRLEPSSHKSLFAVIDSIKKIITMYD